jgi:thiamine-monophosphate kinase
VELVGGNVSRADVLSVTVSVGGLVPEGRTALGRGGAKPGDVLVVTGGLGEAAAGLAVLEATKGAPKKAHEKKLALAQRRPDPHLAQGLVLGRFASACIDVSDGLVQDVGHLCERSKVGASLDTRRFPVSEALLAWAGSREKAARHMLAGGEDYVLLAAVPEPKLEALLRAMANEALVAVPIGEVTRGATVLVDGRKWSGPRGYVHFR